jgi:hypothetical protein
MCNSADARMMRLVKRTQAWHGALTMPPDHHRAGWSPVGPQLKLNHIKFIYPTAPTRPVSVNMGMPMPSWFDITHLDQSGLQDMMKGAAGEGDDRVPGVATWEIGVRLIVAVINHRGRLPGGSRG